MMQEIIKNIVIDERIKYLHLEKEVRNTFSELGEELNKWVIRHESVLNPSSDNSIAHITKSDMGGFIIKIEFRISIYEKTSVFPFDDDSIAVGDFRDLIKRFKNSGNVYTQTLESVIKEELEKELEINITALKYSAMSGGVVIEITTQI